jgi:hypothetical protein
MVVGEELGRVRVLSCPDFQAGRYTAAGLHISLKPAYIFEACIYLRSLHKTWRPASYLAAAGSRLSGRLCINLQACTSEDQARLHAGRLGLAA